MVLVEKRIFGGGIALIVVGISLTILLSASMPVGHTGMTEEQTIDLLIAQQEIEDYNTLSGILIGVGFLLILISFGAKNKRSSNTKKVEKKTTMQ